MRCWFTSVLGAQKEDAKWDKLCHRARSREISPGKLWTDLAKGYGGREGHAYNDHVWDQEIWSFYPCDRSNRIAPKQE